MLGKSALCSTSTHQISIHIRFASALRTCCIRDNIHDRTAPQLQTQILCWRVCTIVYVMYASRVYSASSHTKPPPTSPGIIVMRIHIHICIVFSITLFTLVQLPFVRTCVSAKFVFVLRWGCAPLRLARHVRLANAACIVSERG